DLGAVGSRAWETVGVRSMRAVDAPMLIDSYGLQEAVVSSPMVAPMLAGLRPLGLVGLGMLPGPLSRPLRLTRPLLAPAACDGARFAVRRSRADGAALRILGAAPVWMTGGMPLTGLDGEVSFISAIENAGQDRAGGWLTTDVVLWPRPTVLFASRRVLD